MRPPRTSPRRSRELDAERERSPDAWRAAEAPAERVPAGRRQGQDLLARRLRLAVLRADSRTRRSTSTAPTTRRAKAVPQSIPPTAGDGGDDERKKAEWFKMMKDGEPAYSNFDIAAYLTEIILLGCIAHAGRRGQEDGLGRPEHEVAQRVARPRVRPPPEPAGLGTAGDFVGLSGGIDRSHRGCRRRGSPFSYVPTVIRGRRIDRLARQLLVAPSRRCRRRRP